MGHAASDSNIVHNITIAVFCSEHIHERMQTYKLLQPFQW